MATETLEDSNPQQEARFKDKEENKEGDKSKGQEEKAVSEKDASGEVGISDDKNVQEKGRESKEVEANTEENKEANQQDEAEAEADQEIEKDEDENHTGEKDEDHKGETDEEQEDEQEQGEEVDGAETGAKVRARGRPKGSSKEDQNEPKKPKKEKSSKKVTEKKGGSDPATPASERPTRERKTVERYSIPSPGKSGRSSASKTLLIEKGRGTQLKDIPNVAFKLSKRKPDDNLQILHNILFGKKAKAQTLKRNIGQFSGYVWAENEDKHRAKVKEKLDKCVKEKLVDFCDVLNIPISKGSVKKEELSAKLLEFLESPHATTDVLLADIEQKGKKRKSRATPSKSPTEASIETSTKKQKQSSQVGKKRKHSSEIEEDDKAEPSDAKNDSQEDEHVSVPNDESDHEENKSEEEEDKPKALKRTSKKIAEKTSVGKTEDRVTPSKKTTTAKAYKSLEKTPKKSISKKTATEHDSASATPSKSKQSSSKKQKTARENQDSKGKAVGKKLSDKSSKVSRKGKSGKKAKAEPSREEMHVVVVDILKQVDFNTATLSDILRQLGTHFGLDLMHRKAEVKDIITDVINNMSDEEDEEEAENAGDDEADKDDDDA